MNAGRAAGAGLPIAAVERDTGLSKDTLRIWERRYGFPRPLRDDLGERVYPPEQVEKLRLLRRLMDGGHRPGKLVGLPLAQLQALRAPPGRLPSGDAGLLAPYWGLLQAHDGPGLRRQLQQAVLQVGLARFVAEHVASMNAAVGEGWMRGELSVAQEHVYAEALQGVLRQAIASMPEPREGSPRVLMATLPQEPHGLGLLMVEAMLGVHGWRCVSLGVEVPVDDIVQAATLVQAHIVALSFSGSFPAAHAAAGLAELRRLLPPSTWLWAGGSSLALQRRLPAGVESVPDIDLVPHLVRRWTAAAGPPTA